MSPSFKKEFESLISETVMKTLHKKDRLVATCSAFKQNLPNEEELKVMNKIDISSSTTPSIYRCNNYIYVSKSKEDKKKSTEYLVQVYKASNFDLYANIITEKMCQYMIQIDDYLILACDNIVNVHLVNEKLKRFKQFQCKSSINAIL